VGWKLAKPTYVWAQCLVEPIDDGLLPFFYHSFEGQIQTKIINVDL
jgi:hypothetical protein